MRYLVRARVKPGCEGALLKAIEDGTLGKGSIAEGEYLRNIAAARFCRDETARWVVVCYCPTPLEEERPYWEQYLSWRRCRTPMIGGVAGIRLAKSPGLAVIAIALTVWRRNWKRWENRFSNHCGASWLIFHPGCNGRPRHHARLVRVTRRGGTDVSGSLLAFSAPSF